MGRSPSGASRGAWWGRLALLALGLFLPVLLLEAVLAVAAEQAKFPRRVVEAPWGLRYNEPGARYRHKSADVTIDFRINGQGMRSDRDHAYAKPPGKLRIVSLGDSFTVGYEVDVAETFSSVVERELGAAGLDVEVLNAGVSGFSTAEELQYLTRELIRYDPDLVLVSFYGNDLVDNVRTGLYGLDGAQLVEQAERYVPAGRLAEFLNTNFVFNILSERSNAFVFVKERLTYVVKESLVRQNQARLEAAEGGPGAPAAASDDRYEERLGGAIFESMYAFLRERGIPLVIHGVPSQAPDGPGLIDLFPHGDFDVARPGVLFVDTRAVLEPHAADQLLYWTRSHGHWTPFSHEQAGREIARAILGAGALR